MSPDAAAAVAASGTLLVALALAATGLRPGHRQRGGSEAGQLGDHLPGEREGG